MFVPFWDLGFQAIFKIESFKYLYFRVIGHLKTTLSRKQYQYASKVILWV